MHTLQNITPNIIYVGGNDRRLALFENMFPLTNGVAYNSYVILDEKTALLDTVDSAISQLYLENVEAALNGRPLDYLIINHMEPDHCANIEAIAKLYPNVKVVGNKKTFQFFEQYYRLDLKANYIEVKEKDEISLGKHTLRFYMAPMVHWPEAMMTYEVSEEVLFSADAFGSFGAINGNLFADEVDLDDEYMSEARRYYSNIVGRFGTQVQAVLKKFKDVPIQYICPLHGLVWRKNLDQILDKYVHWASYTPEKKGVVLAYASMYGNTENAVMLLATKLAQKGIKDIRIFDVSKTHISYIISEIWKYSHVVFASPTYNMHLYFGMDALLRDLASLNLRNRKVSLIGNHS
ncbi:MAG: FprA family A-type flavoprotein, partial [Vallitaleaceae bacterium]|nr:FprA family A-type flavoprotein [Vallitaleaceae bacterium]